MSMRTIARSSSNRKSASDLASSVLPTPVGPRNRNDPVGRSGSEMPARERRTASETAPTAARWPISRSPITSSMRSSLAVSPSSSRPVGMPVQASTTSAISSGPTSSRTIGSVDRLLGLARPARAASRARGSRRKDLAGASPRSPSRWQPVGLHAQLVDLLAQLADALERGLLALPTRPPARAAPPRGRRGRRAASRAGPWRRRRPRGASASSSIFIRSTWRRSSSISTGLDSISMRSREADSSTRSIALSGSCRPVM